LLKFSDIFLKKKKRNSLKKKRKRSKKNFTSGEIKKSQKHLKPFFKNNLIFLFLIIINEK
jgi:hypothetical protein